MGEVRQGKGAIHPRNNSHINTERFMNQECVVNHAVA